MKLLPSFESILLAVGIALLPVYAFGSGGIQPSHVVLAAFFGFYFLRHGVPLPNWAIFLGAMSGYVFLVEVVYLTLGSDPKHLINAVYFIYNFFLSIALYGFCRRKGLGPIAIGLTCATFLAVSAVLLSGIDLREMGETGRSTGTFNNPNQLGYFSVSIVSITYLLYRHGTLNYPVSVGFFAGALFLSIASLSKAALVANMVVIFFALKPASSRKTVILWGAGVVSATAGLLWMFSGGVFDEYLFVERLATLSQEGDSSLVSRGYLAFLEGNGMQLIFGLGAENADDIVGHEVHSTVGSVMNNYGFVGLALFSSVLVIWVRLLWISYGFLGVLCLAGPTMLYGITHNGMRFTIFWVLIAASLAMARQGARLMVQRQYLKSSGRKKLRLIESVD